MVPQSAFQKINLNRITDHILSDLNFKLCDNYLLGSILMDKVLLENKLFEVMLPNNIKNFN